MITLVLISLAIFHIYLLVVYLMYGPTFSISNTYYALPKKYNFLFTLYCWAYAGLLLPPAMEIFGTPWLFFTVGAICFVGAAAAFRGDKLTESVHMKSAMVAVIGSQLSLIFDFKYYVLSAVTLLLGGLIYYLGSKGKFLTSTYVYYAEIIFAESIYIAFLMKLLS